MGKRSRAHNKNVNDAWAAEDLRLMKSKLGMDGQQKARGDNYRRRPKHTYDYFEHEF